MADCAKLEFNMAVVRDNVDMKWSGYNDSLINFVSETLQKIFAMKSQELREIFN